MLIFAHRGASGIEPENTLLAIQAALDMKVDAIEIDVHLGGGQLVIIHNRTVDKTTNGNGPVSNMTFQQLRELNAGKGQKIPTLEEVFTLVNGQCLINIELKSVGTVEGTLALIDQAVNNQSFQLDQFLISSFNHHLLAEVKALNPSINTGALTAGCPYHYAEFAEQLNSYSVHIDIDFVNQAFVDDAHYRGLKVYVYTVDGDDDIIAMHRLGVDGIFSNHPNKSSLKLAHLRSSAFS